MPYEQNKGETEKKTQIWLEKLRDDLYNGKGNSHSDMKQMFPEICRDFSTIPVKRVPKVKVGVVGEIYVKYSPLGNNNLEAFLAQQGCEVNLPGLLGFIEYCISNMGDTVRFYGGNKGMVLLSEMLLSDLDKLEQAACNAMKAAGYHAPARFSQLRHMGDGIISRGNKMGEGWLLTAEMVELVTSGYENIVCAQPFGCLPNHICGKGMIGPIRTLYPNANITPIDYDPSATPVNQENRIKLMLSVAKERLDQNKKLADSEAQGCAL